MEDFILEIPKWEGVISFSDEWITLILVIIALVSGILLCFWGYRYFQSVALVILGCLCGIIGYKVGESMTTNLVLQMCIFVIFTFLGVCLFYLLSILLVYILNKIGIRSFLQRSLHIIASVAGALIVGFVTYTMVYCNLVVVIVGTVLLAAAGILYGIRNVKARRVFRTYEDLVKMNSLTEENANA